DESVRMLEGERGIDAQTVSTRVSSQTLQITSCDRQALQLLAAGHSKDDVAVGLGISAWETETQLTKCFANIGGDLSVRGYRMREKTRSACVGYPHKAL